MVAVAVGMIVDVGVGGIAVCVTVAVAGMMVGAGVGVGAQAARNKIKKSIQFLSGATGRERSRRTNFRKNPLFVCDFATAASPLRDCVFLTKLKSSNPRALPKCHVILYQLPSP